MDAAVETRVLCVDDEPGVLEGLTLNLRRTYKVHTATSGAEGLEVLAKHGPFAVVLSDMRMPGMDGAAFLARACEVAPDASRMLLTGQSELDAAVRAINEGRILRFLTKPCPRPTLLAAFQDAAEHHRLRTAERVLLEQTLQGSIRALLDILALTQPAAFGRAARVRDRALVVAEAAGVGERWPIEMAAMLSQIGSVTLPHELADKLYQNQPLSESEERQVARLPMVAEKLLANIPRLDAVRAIIARQMVRFDDPTPSVPVGARVLRLVLDYDQLEARGTSPDEAVGVLRSRRGLYDPALLELLAQALAAPKVAQELSELPLKSLRPGMVFAAEVRSRGGALLLGSGFEVTAALLERLGNYPAGTIAEPLRVLVPRPTLVRS
jgi:response regulator RpfG family c-di-GMP phosphodiesterase